MALEILGKKLAKKAAEGALESVAKKSRAMGKKSDVVPPPFERAPAKTKEEIDVIARRVAPQITGEFVRLNPKQSVNPAGLSRKRFEIEKELEHDIRPVQEVREPATFDYAANEGKVQLGVFGDPTITQQDIYEVGGRRLALPSRQYGGPRYPMYEPEDAWSSNFGAASGVQSAAERASKQYGGVDVLGLYTKMGADSYYYAQHLSDALMKNIMPSLADMSKKDIAGFNKMVRNNPKARDFAGIENPDISLAQMEKNPEMRKHFSKLATTPTYTEAFNMPNGLDVVHATLEPELRNLERGVTGYSIVDLDPSIKELHAASHPTYDTRIPRKAGTEVQKLEVPYPYDIQYPDQLLAISKNPKQADQPFGTLMMSGARQIIDPQHIDEVGLYREFIKKYTGKKKGGAVKMAGGGAVYKAAQKLLKKMAKKTEYELAHEQAQKNAVEMLGLPPDNTAKDRARAMGFDVDNPVYHGTTSDIKEIDPGKFGTSTETYSGESGFWSSDDPLTAKSFADYAAYYKPVNKNPRLMHLTGKEVKRKYPNRRQNIIPMYINKSDMLSSDQGGKAWSELMDNPELENKFSEILDRVNYGEGKVGEFKNFHDAAAEVPAGPATHYFSPKPSSYRSIHAAFDPAEAESGDLLKSTGGGVRMAGGGIAKKIASKLAKEVTEDIKLPPAENSARTQIVGTIPTYHKARDILKGHGIEGEKIIDMGAGKGLGSTIMKAHSMEPYAQGWEPTFTRAADIPSDTYEGLTNLNVLNVVSPEIRRGIVEDIGRVLKPQGGVGLITTRGKDVLNTVGGTPGPEPMSMITSRDTYQKGFTQQELFDYIKDVLGDKFEYEKLDLGPAGVKIIKKAEGGKITTPEIEVKPEDKREVLKEIPRGKISGKIADILKPAAEFLGEYEVLPQVPLLGGTSVAELTGVEGLQTLAEDISRGYRPIRNLERGKLQSSYFDPRLLDAVDLATTAAGGVGLAKNLGKTAIKEAGKQIETGTGMLGRNVVDPRHNIIKDPGGMVVGGERELDRQLTDMYKNESIDNYDGTYGHDQNAAALNNWVNTKVRKYIRNQAGTKDDPILKAIESGVEHNFSPAIGDTKYYVRNKRELVGKPVEGIAKTDLGKEWEYKVDSTFTPKKSSDIKEILNSPMEFTDPATADRRRASLLRVEHDLPIHNEKDLEALKLINQIPDENVYTIDVSSLTNRLGLNHVSDVLMEDLQTGRLRPEQLDQMSIEKAVRRAAEYDAQKAREMTKAHATSVEGMPIPKQYDDGFKWVELKHESDPKKTASALESEGEMMGHCVGSYCPQVESGRTKIYSLRSPDGKSHVTIEATKNNHLNDWLEANKEEIEKDPLLKQMAYYDPDEKYPGMYSEEEVEQAYIADITKMLKAKGAPVYEAPNSWIDIVQIKGKQNKRPDDKYQKYVEDFISNNPTGYDIADVHELHNTNLMNVNEVGYSGIVPKDVHFHPDVTKALKVKYPAFNNLMSADKEEMTYELMKEAAHDLAKKEKFYFTQDDLLNQIRDKYIKPIKKAKGGPITKKDLENQMKLDNIVDTQNLRRRYG